MRKIIALFILALAAIELVARLVYGGSAPPAPCRFTLTDGGYMVPDVPRETVGNPAGYVATIWLFGNSAAFGYGVAARDTVASRLQRLVPNYRVVNLSADGQRAVGQVAWLRDTAVKRGDIVIFFDGAQDASVIHRYAKPVARWIWDACGQAPGERGIVSVMILVCRIAPTIPADGAALRAQIAEYRQAVAAGRELAEKQGAMFLHFLQPGVAEFFPDEYAVIGEDEIHLPPGAFLDTFGHFNGDGAEIAAQAVYEQLTIY